MPRRQEAPAPDNTRGLYLEVSPGGSKRWFQKLYVDGKDTRLALDSYPAVSLADARSKQAEVKAQRAQKLNPIAECHKARARHVDSLATNLRAQAIEHALGNPPCVRWQKTGALHQGILQHTLPHRGAAFALCRRALWRGRRRLDAGECRLL